MPVLDHRVDAKYLRPHQYLEVDCFVDLLAQRREMGVGNPLQRVLVAEVSGKAKQLWAGDVVPRARGLSDESFILETGQQSVGSRPCNTERPCDVDHAQRRSGLQHRQEV